MKKRTFNVKICGLPEAIDKMEDKTRCVSDQIVVDNFSEDLFHLIAIADRANMGKTKAIIYAFKLGFIAGKDNLKKDLLNNFSK